MPAGAVEPETTPPPLPPVPPVAIELPPYPPPIAVLLNAVFVLNATVVSLPFDPMLPFALEEPAPPGPTVIVIVSLDILVRDISTIPPAPPPPRDPPPPPPATATYPNVDPYAFEKVIVVVTDTLVLLLTT